jgi:predicted TIM-barrel fold metal-dependent hydrolase
MSAQATGVDIDASSVTGFAERPSRKRSFPVVDTDVHHSFADKSELYPYLSEIYRDRFADYGLGVGSSTAHNGGFRGRRADTIDVEKTQPDNIGTSAINVEDTRTQLLDAAGIDIAILTGGGVGSASAMMDIDYATAICRAFNDYTIDHWLAADSRFRFTIAINHQDPVGSAVEIDRIGDHPGVVGVMMTCGAPKPFGFRSYHPIYEACERHGIAVAMHFGAEGSGINPPPTSAGYPSYYIESRQARPSFYSAHISSFIFEGVFEKFPTLKVAMLEGGFAWVPPLMWKMDLDWKGLRHQVPWVENLPSEYVKEHIRFATQPMEEPDKPDALKHVIDWMEGDRTLMFATDYPHWDWDDPAMTLTGFPDDLRRRIFFDNAVETFNLNKNGAIEHLLGGDVR